MKRVDSNNQVTTYLEEHNLIEPCIAWLEKNYPGERYFSSIWYLHKNCYLYLHLNFYMYFNVVSFCFKF